MHQFNTSGLIHFRSAPRLGITIPTVLPRRGDGKTTKYETWFSLDFLTSLCCAASHVRISWSSTDRDRNQIDRSPYKSSRAYAHTNAASLQCEVSETLCSSKTRCTQPLFVVPGVVVFLLFTLIIVTVTRCSLSAMMICWLFGVKLFDSSCVVLQYFGFPEVLCQRHWEGCCPFLYFLIIPFRFG
mmetsp:Transcript_19986/g.55136  ORF Transcript_19986/g.55136 Transcript_19986/m.55136 type:complete len:185 (-) Transcript_19986:52-606(-)